MEVQGQQQPQQLSTEQAAPDTVPQQMPAQDVAIDNGTANGQGNVDMDMDMDIDIDLGDQHELEPAPEPEPEPMQHEYLETEPVLTTAVAADAYNGAIPPSDEEPLFEKVHIRGVDELTTNDIKSFANEHFPDEAPLKVEWIDDTSANIIYSSPETGLRALKAFSQESVEEGLEDADAQAQGQQQHLHLRTAKSLSNHPDSVLQVRAAVVSDKKRARAHEASRFYLLHPEHDPRERVRSEFAQRRRHGGGRRGDDDGYNRRRFDDREHRRRRDRADDENLTASMYDDVPMEGTAERGRKELFPDSAGAGSRRRDRSASPDAGSTSDRERGSRSRAFRDRSPRSRGGRDRDTNANRGKELFADREPKELFPTGSTTTTSGTSYLKGEVSAISSHRRSRAFDKADVTTEFSRRLSASGPSSGSRGKPVELFPEHAPADGGLHIRGQADSGLNIRGAANRDGNEFTIKGSAAAVRELFPSKYNANAGKELFSDKIQGRGGRRKKAEDMYG